MAPRSPPIETTPTDEEKDEELFQEARLIRLEYLSKLSLKQKRALSGKYLVVYLGKVIVMDSNEQVEEFVKTRSPNETVGSCQFHYI